MVGELPCTLGITAISKATLDSVFTTASHCTPITAGYDGENIGNLRLPGRQELRWLTLRSMDAKAVPFLVGCQMQLSLKKIPAHGLFSWER